MTVPGKSVVLPLRNSISAGTSKIMSLVVQSCSTSPLTTVAAVVAAPVGVVLISQILPGFGVLGGGDSLDLRRAEAAHVPRPRRIDEPSGGSTPERVAVDSMAGSLFELPEGHTGDVVVDEGYQGRGERLVRVGAAVRAVRVEGGQETGPGTAPKSE